MLNLYYRTIKRRKVWQKVWQAMGVLLLMAAALATHVQAGVAARPLQTNDQPLNTYTVTTTNDAGSGSLRQALLDANSHAGLDMITFSIGSGYRVISPTTALPVIIDPLVLDGTTQPGYAGIPVIELNGGNAGAAPIGLHITAGSSTVRGLILAGWEVPNPGLGRAVLLEGGSGNIVRANCIGTNATCDGADAATANDVGVHVLNSANNQIGGTPSGSRNIISGNRWDGVLIEGAGATGNVVQRNYIGTDVSGSAALPNNYKGIEIRAASGNLIGGTVPEVRNLISGNYDGVLIAEDASGNTLQGNYIGTDATGAGAVGNGTGVWVFGDDNLIGGLVPGAGNVISGNGNDSGVSYGVSLSGERNRFYRNLVGTTAAGTQALPNIGPGVWIGGGYNVVGAQGGANVISGNTADGVGLPLCLGCHSAGIGNRIQSNVIGANPAGTAPIPNGSNGVGINWGTDTLIGGEAAGEGNLISGNRGHGIGIFANVNGPVGAIIQGNKIGTDAAGTGSMGNWLHGVFFSSTTYHPPITGTVGGSTPDRANLIAHNGRDAVSVVGANSHGIAVLGNSLHSNGRLGIDLNDDGHTPNDPGDGDSGPNNLQNYPLLTHAGSGGGSTTVEGTLNSTSNTTFLLQFYANAACDIYTVGEGQTYLGSTAVTTNGAGNAGFSATFATGVPLGHVIAATALDPQNNTSEFSPCQEVTVPNTATRTPTRTPTATVTLTHTATATGTRTATRTATSTATATRTPTHTPTRTPTVTPTRTPTATATTSTRLLVGHVTWQGRPAQPNAANQLPITLTLKLGGTYYQYPNQQTDANGNFSVMVTTLPNGVYTWWAKGPRWLATGGTVTLSGAPTTNVELGQQRAGDVDNTNLVDITDFSLTRAGFGKACGDTGYDGRADWTGDCLVDIADFTLLRANFGQAGASPP